MNTFREAFEADMNIKYTENGAKAHKSTTSKVYDLFAFGGAYRARTDIDKILLFKEALEENETLALKCLFYLRDVRGGQGERNFFRTIYRWLCETNIDIALRNIELIPEYGRWDDLIYICEGTAAETVAFGIIKKQLLLDIKCKTPSLLGKWMPSENTSSQKTRAVANKLRTFIGLSHKDYRLLLSKLRERIKVVERLMSANKWEEIEFDKIPSKAGLIYKNAFARRDLIKEKYRNFITNKNTTVNAKTLYPYEVVAQANNFMWRKYDPTDVDRIAVNKYWANLPNYFEDSDNSLLTVIDTSGSMTWGTTPHPIDVAIGLGMYAGAYNKGIFKNCYISFASRPQLMHIEGLDFVDKVRRIYETNLCDSTNLQAVFDLLFSYIKIGKAKASDLPETIVIISDMEIDSAVTYRDWGVDGINTQMERLREEWAAAGIKLPHLVYWNVAARNNTILDSGPDVTFCSGASPVLFKQILTGKKGVDLMLETLYSDRYVPVQ